jgi:hypothetical protein
MQPGDGSALTRLASVLDPGDKNFAIGVCCVRRAQAAAVRLRLGKLGRCVDVEPSVHLSTGRRSLGSGSRRR